MIFIKKSGAIVATSAVSGTEGGAGSVNFWFPDYQRGGYEIRSILLKRWNLMPELKRVSSVIHKLTINSFGAGNFELPGAALPHDLGVCPLLVRPKEPLLVTLDLNFCNGDDCFELIMPVYWIEEVAR